LIDQKIGIFSSITPLKWTSIVFWIFLIENNEITNHIILEIISTQNWRKIYGTNNDWILYKDSSFF